MSPIVSADSHSNRDSVLMLFAITSVIVAIFFDTFVSIVTTWKFETYSHGYFILPISLILVWQKRARLNADAVTRSYIGVAILFGLSVVWWIAESVGIQIVMQYAVVSLVPAAVLTLFGTELTREMRFALLYLLFAVPFGDFFIPYLIDITASFSVDALTLLGFPILRDGQYFQVPSGNYEVAEACSGLRYIVSTSALSVLYAHISFASFRKAAAFVAFAILLSIVANGVRATSIVLLLHYTDLDIAAASDHEFVGWILYGVLIGILLWVGNRFADERAVSSVPHDSRSAGLRTETHGKPSNLVLLIVAGLAVSIGPMLNVASGNWVDAGIKLENGLPVNVDGWATERVVDPIWKPDYHGYAQMSLGTYRRGQDVVNVAMIRYAGQKQGAELSNVSNVVLHRDQWTLGNIVENTVAIDSGYKISLSQIVATRDQQKRLLWFWHEVGGVHVKGNLQTKLLEFKSVFAGTSSGSTAFIISTASAGGELSQQGTLDRFLSSFYAVARVCVDSETENLSCNLGAPNMKED